MADSNSPRSTRSIGLEILIGLLIVVLLTAILYPKKLWNVQTAEEKLCRERMENIFLASEFHRKSGVGLTTSIDDLIKFAVENEIDIPAPGFKVDRLTREDTGIDSFLVEYFDPYQHFSHYEKAPGITFGSGRQSVTLATVPKKEFPFAPVSSVTFESSQPITAVIDDRGDQGTFALVGAQGTIRVSHSIGNSARAKASDFIYFIDSKNLNICPTCQAEYAVGMNLKISIVAEIVAAFEKSAPEKSLGSSEKLASVVVFRLLKEADAAAKRKITEDLVMESVEDSLLKILDKAFLDSTSSALQNAGKADLAVAIFDSTLDNHSGLSETARTEWDKIREASYDRMNTLKNDSAFSAQRDDIVNHRKSLLTAEKFTEGLQRLATDKSLRIDETGIISTTSDSLRHYSATDVIAGRLIHEHLDSVTTAHMKRADVAELLGRFSYTENYKVADVDSIGITVACPIEGEFHKPGPSILDRLFSVGGVSNHGNIRNGDLSWSEKR